MKIVRFVLLGMASLFVVLVIGVVVLFTVSGASDSPASKERLAGVIDRSGLDPKLNYSVVASADAGYLGGGDHEISHCLQLADFPVRQGSEHEWSTGPIDNPVIRSVVYGATLKAQACFPPGIVLNTAALRVRIASIEYRDDGHAEAAAFFLYEPISKRLLYYSFRA